jgi:hypothetical protein
MSKTNPSTKSASYTADELIKKYLEYISEIGSRPGSLYEFAKHFGDDKDNISPTFGSIAQLEAAVWQSFIEENFVRLNAEPAYAEYVARERLLAFYFTLLEVLKPHRKYVKLAPLYVGASILGTDVLTHFKKAFLEYTQGLVNLGIETGEVEQRAFLSDRYNEALWAQCLFILNFWKKDTSEDFQKTDEAVERSVNLSLDLMARGPLDSIVEFGQFLFKNR